MVLVGLSVLSISGLVTVWAKELLRPIENNTAASIRAFFIWVFGL
jgi:hypothetical protein